MRLFIKKVRMNTYNPDTNESFDFWINGVLQSKKEIEILDNLPYDLRNKENKEIECLLFMVINPLPIEDTAEEELTTLIFDGLYLGEYNLPEKWVIPNLFKIKYDDTDIFHAVQVDNDIFIIAPRNLEYYSVKKGEKFTFEAILFELWAWEQI